MLLTALPARADFELPFLNPVPKVLSIPASIDPELIKRFETVSGLSFEIRAVPGNLLPDRLAKTLVERFARNRKLIVLSGAVTQLQVEQLRRLGEIEVEYRIGPSGLDAETTTNLYALGPVHKILVLPETIEPDLQKAIKKLKYYSVALALGQPSLPADLGRLGVLQDFPRQRKKLFLKANSTPALIYDLTRLRPLAIEIATTANRLAPELLDTLKDLRGVELCVAVNGRLTVEDARNLARLERFTLKIEIGEGGEVIPGLGKLLNRIGPP